MVEMPWVIPENADGALDRLSLHVCPPLGGGCVFTPMVSLAQGLVARGDLSGAVFLLTQAHGAALSCPLGCEAERDLESLLLACHASMRARGQVLAGSFAQAFPSVTPPPARFSPPRPEGSGEAAPPRP